MTMPRLTNFTAATPVTARQAARSQRMRAHVLLLVGALAVPCLAGSGCQSPGAATGPRAGAEAPWWETAAAPRPADLPNAVATIPLRGPFPPTEPDGPAGGVVWRASSRSLHADPEDAG